MNNFSIIEKLEIKKPIGILVYANGFFMMSSFLARSAIVVVVGFAGDMIGLKATYLISAVLGLAGLPFILMLPGREDE